MITYSEICAQEAVLSPEDYKALRKSYGLDNVVEAEFEVGERCTIEGESLEVTKIEQDADGGKTIHFKKLAPTT